MMYCCARNEFLRNISLNLELSVNYVNIYACNYTRNYGLVPAFPACFEDMQKMKLPSQMLVCKFDDLQLSERKLLTQHIALEYFTDSEALIFEIFLCILAHSVPIVLHLKPLLFKLRTKN